MRFKVSPQLPGAGRTRAGHHHGSHTPTSPEVILLGKMAHHTKQIRRECYQIYQYFSWLYFLCRIISIILFFIISNSTRFSCFIYPLKFFSKVRKEGDRNRKPGLRLINPIIKHSNLEILSSL